MSRKGYALLVAIAAINIFAIMALMARSMWETEIQRDLEQELLFRAHQYKSAIEFYIKKNNNLFPLNFNDLYEKKFLRQLYKDPMNPDVDGKWDIVMAGALGGNNDLLVVPDGMLGEFLNTARIMGVCSTSEQESFMIYRGKKKYCEWAVYVGEQIDKDMPKLKYVGKTDSKGESSESGASKGDAGSSEEGARETSEAREKPGESSERSSERDKSEK
jgi:type II secretory pathway pseudopilin PulG